MTDKGASTAEDEIAAAKDYWRQLFERAARHPMATLVEREAVLAGAEARARVLLARRGVPADQIEELAARFAVELAAAPVTSPGVDPHAESILGGLCDRIEEAISKVSLIGPVRVARGIEPSVGVFAARLGVILTDASIVTVGSQLFRFCHLVGKALTRTIMIDPRAWDDASDADALRAKLRSRPDILRLWRDIFTSFALTGTPVLVPANAIDPEWVLLKDRLVDAMEIFVVAHEYSHHLQRHGRLLEVSAGSGLDRAARGEEFEADSIAIMLGQLVTGHRPDENILILSGAGMVAILSAIDLLGKTRVILGMEGSHVTQGSHPSVADRFAMIDRQEHLWGHESAPLRAQRQNFIRMLGVVADELLPLIETLAAADELRGMAEDWRNIVAESDASSLRQP